MMRIAYRWVARGVLVLLSVGLVSVDAGAVETQKKPAAKKSVAAQTSKKAPVKRRVTRRRRARRLSRAAAARQAAEAAIPQFKLDASGSLVPALRAAAAIIYDPETNQVLWGENAQTQRSIASITKVMTAVVFLEDNPDLTQQVKIERADVRGATLTSLRINEVFTTEDLLHLLLLPSDNGAARALARVSPQGSAGFMARMNERAAELGLTSTVYADPSGLDANNVSSAYDMARLISFVSSDERIGPIMRKAEHTVQTQRRKFAIRSTNQLVRAGDLDVRGGKTGFIAQAGYCFATLLRMPQGGQVAVVVLGARSNVGRFMETRHLWNWFSSRAQDLFSYHQRQN